MSLAVLSVLVAVEAALFVLVSTGAMSAPRRLNRNNYWRQ